VYDYSLHSEVSLSAFTRNGSPDIDEWLADFELNSIKVGWTDLQKFIYGRQLVKGAAKLFLGRKIYRIHSGGYTRVEAK